MTWVNIGLSPSSFFFFNSKHSNRSLNKTRDLVIDVCIPDTELISYVAEINQQVQDIGRGKLNTAELIYIEEDFVTWIMLCDLTLWTLCLFFQNPPLPQALNDSGCLLGGTDLFDAGLDDEEEESLEAIRAAVKQKLKKHKVI